jgi:Cupin
MERLRILASARSPGPLFSRETRGGVPPTGIRKILDNQQANAGLFCECRDLLNPLRIARQFQKDDLPDALLSNNTMKHDAIRDTRNVERAPSFLAPGDMYFIPKGYPHHIENLTDEEMRFLIFFDQTTPEDIGFTGALSAFPRRIIAPTLGCTEGTLPQLPAYPADLLMVEKINLPLP